MPRCSCYGPCKTQDNPRLADTHLCQKDQVFPKLRQLLSTFHLPLLRSSTAPPWPHQEGHFVVLETCWIEYLWHSEETIHWSTSATYTWQGQSIYCWIWCFEIHNRCCSSTSRHLLWPHSQHPIAFLSYCSMSFILARSAMLLHVLPLTVLLVTLLFLAPIVFPCI